MPRFMHLFIYLCGLFSTFCHAEWTTSPPALISSTYSYSYRSVFNSSDSTTGVLLATWANGNNNQYPTYSFYTPNVGWGAIDTISTVSSVVVTTNVLTSCNSQSGQFLASWTDANTLFPTISVYSPGSGWSAIDPLPTTTAVAHTASSFDPLTGNFLVTWADANNNNPSYSFYTPTAGWGPVDTISTTTNAANVFTSFNSATGQFLATWTDISTGLPMYSFYDSGTWSPATAISLTSSAANDVFSSCNPATGVIMATWADINQSLYPFYSVYTPGSGWSPIDTITTTSSVIDNVTISCDLNTGHFLAFWSNLSNGDPTYSFYTLDNGWSSPAIIASPASTASDIFSSFNSLTGQFLTTWSDNSNNDLIFVPTYSFLTNVLPPSLPPPPSSFVGTALHNCFLKRTYKLDWTPPSNFFSIVSYQISRNGNVIAVLPASGPFTYIDHIRRLKREEVYTIVSIDAAGRQSAPLTLTWKLF